MLPWRRAGLVSKSWQEHRLTRALVGVRGAPSSSEDPALLVKSSSDQAVI